VCGGFVIQPHKPRNLAFCLKSNYIYLPTCTIQRRSRKEQDMFILTSHSTEELQRNPAHY